MRNNNEEQNKQTRLILLICTAIIAIIIFLIVLGFRNLDKTPDTNVDNLLKTPDISSNENSDDKISDLENKMSEKQKDSEESEKDKYKDPFYNQIRKQIKRQKHYGFNDLSYNYYPGENYINNAADEDGTLHIFKKNPIMIYVPKGEYYDAITQAFVSYNYNFKGVLSFKATDNPEESDIRIVLSDNFSSSSDLADAIGLGSPRRFDNEGNILYSELQILNQNHEGGYKPSMIAVYNTALHEIGHCIGILGHSSNPADVMYKSLSERDTKKLKEFSSRDKETIKLMYSGRNDYIANALKNAKQEKLQENIDYAKESNNSDSYLNVADSYYSMKQYDKALEAYKKALKLNKNNYRIYIKLALCYEQAKKYDEQITFAKYAIKKSSTNEQRAFANIVVADGYVRKQEYEEALYYSYTAMVLDQNQKEYYINYLALCNMLNRKSKARDAYDSFGYKFNSSLSEEEQELVDWAKS